MRQDEISNALTSSNTQSLEEIISQSAREIAKSLPTHLRPERIIQIALTCIRTNPELAKCTPASFLGSLFVSAQLGLEPIAGNAYILPFNNNRKKADGSWHTVKEAQFLIGYKGLATLFYRHEKAVQLNWGVVYKNDEFEYQYGTNSFLNHKPAPKNRGEVIGFYVVAKLSNGGQTFMYMSKEDCMAHGKKHSKTFSKKDNEFMQSSPWITNTEAMCLKTVLIQLAKLLPLSFELQQAISADETSREYRLGIDNALDLPDNTEWEDAEMVVEKEEPKDHTQEKTQMKTYGEIEQEIKSAEKMSVLKKIVSQNLSSISKMPKEWQDQLHQEYNDRKNILASQGAENNEK